MEINLAYYRQKDWKKFITMVADPEKLHDSWEEWHQSYLNAKQQLSQYGYKVNKVKVNLNDLNNFCKQNGLRLDGPARSQYVSEIFHK